MPNQTTTVHEILRNHLQYHQITLEDLAKESLDAAYHGSFAVLYTNEVTPLDGARLLHFLHQTASLFIELRDRAGADLELHS